MLIAIGYMLLGAGVLWLSWVAWDAADFIFERIGEEHPALEQRAYLVQQLVQDSLYAMDALRRGL